MNNERLYKVVLSPHTSEKGTLAADNANRIVLRVARGATKPEIKAAVEMLFDVTVRDVTVVNVKGKAKRFGARRGQRSDWKKAYVRLGPGQDIDFTTVG